ncbi:hypothetical protein MHBO_004593 [Bonamia ostreae]|uniref:Uncharacterized protein n=1 Tax=Bonamia ostreae TaxID=126728 RepID=A0ABV2ATS2_9EUKA
MSISYLFCVFILLNLHFNVADDECTNTDVVPPLKLTGSNTDYTANETAVAAKCTEGNMKDGFELFCLNSTWRFDDSDPYTSVTQESSDKFCEVDNCNLSDVKPPIVLVNQMVQEAKNDTSYAANCAEGDNTELFYLYCFKKVWYINEGEKNDPDNVVMNETTSNEFCRTDNAANTQIPMFSTTLFAILLLIAG